MDIVDASERRSMGHTAGPRGVSHQSVTTICRPGVLSIPRAVALRVGFGGRRLLFLEVIRMMRWLVILGIAVCLLLLLSRTAGGQRDFVAGGAIAANG